jgi:hypothetical protein
MSIRVELKIDTRNCEAFLFGLPEQVLQRATARSLNRTILTIREISRKGISDKLKLKSTEITKGLPITGKAKPTESIDEQRAVMEVSSKPQSLYYFSPQQTSRGVSVNVKGQRRVINHAFIAKMPNGGSGVFIRKRALSKFAGITARRVGPQQSELPIQKLYTTRISEAFTDQKGRFLTEGQIQLNKEMKANFTYYYDQYLSK